MRICKIATLLLLFPATAAIAQSGTDSPYSQFGLGMLADQSSGYSRGMNGVSIGFHEHNQINYLNPASYSALDSLTFIFDVGMSGTFTNYKENGVKKNSKQADFEYAIGGFRLYKSLGLGFGILPYTNVGYSYSSTETVANDRFNTSTVNSYNADGGLHQLFIGLGWSPLKGLSIGVNGSYLYGSIDRSVVNSFSSSTVNTQTRYYSADVRSYKLDFGAQYTMRLSKKDEMTVGLTYSPGHKIGGKPTMQLISSNAQTSDTISYPGANEPRLHLETPNVLGIGLMYNRDNKLKVGLDYTLQKWSSVSEPEVQSNEGQVSYDMGNNQFKDRHKFALGAVYCPGENNRKFLKRVQYKAGLAYSTPYYYINGQDGPKEFSASVGFGIPIINSWNNRSILTISGQWVHQSAKNFITDNSFRINVGLTFNERWFAKWKVE